MNDERANDNELNVPMYMCSHDEHIYMEKVTDCDCTDDEPVDWIEGVASFPLNQ